MNETVKVEGHCHERFEPVRAAFEASFAPAGVAIEDEHELGGSIAIAVGGELVVELWGGHSDVARTRPWQRDTIVNTFSTTKGVVALCVHHLVEAGKLDLDAPVAEVWPEFAAAGKAQVPVHQLLSHRVGLPALREKIPYEKRFDWDTIANALAAEEPWWEPGSKHGYHAVTYGYLAGEVVRRVDGRSIGRYFREELAEPAGLDIHIGFGPELDARCAELEVVAPGAPAAATSAAPAAAGGTPRPNPDIMARVAAERDSLSGLAFANPSVPRVEYNSRAFRAAEIPAYNGHGTAASFARMYSGLADNGRLGDVHLLGADALARATEEHAMGRDEVLAPVKTRFGLGFMLSFKGLPLGRSPRGFGHPGFGGSLAFADPDERLGFAYVTNRAQNALLGSRRSFGLIRPLYKALTG